MHQAHLAQAGRILAIEMQLQLLTHVKPDTQRQVRGDGK